MNSSTVRVSFGVTSIVYKGVPEVREFIGPAASKPESIGERAKALGTQVAHELGGEWYLPGGWRPVVDPAVLQQIEDAVLVA